MKKITGMKQGMARQIADAIDSERGDWQNEDNPINAHCDKCGAGLRATPALLAAVKLGVVDDGNRTNGVKCGGTFRADSPAQSNREAPRTP